MKRIKLFLGVLALFGLLSFACNLPAAGTPTQPPPTEATEKPSPTEIPNQIQEPTLTPTEAVRKLSEHLYLNITTRQVEWRGDGVQVLIIKPDLENWALSGWQITNEPVDPAEDFETEEIWDCTIHPLIDFPEEFFAGFCEQTTIKIPLPGEGEQVDVTIFESGERFPYPLNRLLPQGPTG